MSQYLCSQIVIGIILGLFSAFPSVLFVQLFRRIRSHRQQLSPLRQTLETMAGHKLE
jgi:H+/Cl- antiporter ClcA